MPLPSDWNSMATPSTLGDPRAERERRLASEVHALRAKLTEAERELDRRDRVIAKQALRIDALELDLTAANTVLGNHITDASAGIKPPGDHDSNGRG